MPDLLEAFKVLLMGRNATTQEAICEALQEQGFEINQTKVSRLLRKIGAAKVVNAKGEVAYSLPREPSPPTPNTPLRHLIVEVVANETMIVILTSPGSASMVGRVLDYQKEIEILGTVAGDDTIFVVPKSIKDTKKVAEKIKKVLLG